MQRTAARVVDDDDDDENAMVVARRCAKRKQEKSVVSGALRFDHAAWRLQSGQFLPESSGTQTAKTARETRGLQGAWCGWSLQLIVVAP